MSDKSPVTWRRTKYLCGHAQQVDDTEVYECSLGLCQQEDLVSCCVECPDYVGPDRGIGDTIKRVASKVGVKPCGGCQKRREALNKMTGKFFKAGENDDS